MGGSSIGENRRDELGGRPCGRLAASVPYGHRMAALAFFLSFTSGALYLYSRGIFVRDQIVDFEASRTEISLAFAAVQVVGFMFAPILGHLLDRYPIRNVMTVGAAWLGCGFFVMSTAASVREFALMSVAFIGLGSSTIGASANSKLMVNWFDRHRGMALSVSIMGYSIAGMAMAPVAVYLLDTLGWRGAYVLFGAICLLVVAPVVALTVRQRPSAPAGQSADTPAAGRVPDSRVMYPTFAKSAPFWGAVIAFGLMTGVQAGLNLHLFLHYTELGLDEYAAASILTVSAAFGLACKPLFGALIDRCGARTAILTMMACCSTALLGFALASSHALLFVAGAWYGLAFAGLMPLQAEYLSRLFGERAFGRAFGSLRLCSFPLAVACTPLIGHVYDRSGSYVPAFYILLALFLGITAIAWLSIPTSRRDALRSRQ